MKPASDWWDEKARPQVTIKYLTRLFENPFDTLAPFTDAQVNQGLWYIADLSCSDYMYVLLTDNSVRESDRLRGIESAYTLFEKFFAVQCSAHLSHRDEPGANPLNSVCYMWWDLLDMNSRILPRIMEKQLHLNSIACQESALHGLGHAHRYFPREVETIIDDFLSRKLTMRPELKTYALNARSGCIL